MRTTVATERRNAPNYKTTGGGWPALPRGERAARPVRKLEDAGYITTEKNGSGVTARTSVALTFGGRSALERYSAVLRELLDSARPR